MLRVSRIVMVPAYRIRDKTCISAVQNMKSSWHSNEKRKGTVAELQASWLLVKTKVVLIFWRR